MKWEKLGKIFDIKKTPLKQSHAQCPVVEDLNDKWRIYYSSRCKENKSRVFYFDVEVNNPFKILNAPDEPVFELGERGLFDCDGLMPSCIADFGIYKKFYLVGWNVKVSVPYQQSIGVATKKQGYWEKIKSPVLDRNLADPYACTSPFVLYEESIYKMWYSSITEWEEIGGRLECKYNIKHAYSSDGFHWRIPNTICLDYDEFTDAICWQHIWREGFYKMVYCYRSNKEFRTNRNHSYKLGYAESKDGITWKRKDNEVGIDKSNDENDWDYNMIAYPRIHKGFMFYNGNDFGKSGIGVAKLVS